MRKNKIYDCITFFQENFITNIRFEILNKHVDFFIVCESIYDHRGKKKEINFKLKNPYFKDKVRHIILRDPFPEKLNSWERQAFQREYIFNGIKDSHDEDYIMFSDPDEIPKPEELKNFILKKKYAIFQQKCFNYKFNLLNINETPWSGTRLTKRKFLKSFDYMRQKILKKNIKKFLCMQIIFFENTNWIQKNFRFYWPNFKNSNCFCKTIDLVFKTIDIAFLSYRKYKF